MYVGLVLGAGRRLFWLVWVCCWVGSKDRIYRRTVADYDASDLTPRIVLECHSVTYGSIVLRYACVCR